MLSLDDYNDNMNDLDTKKSIVENCDFSIMVLVEAMLLEKDLKSAKQFIRIILKRWDEFRKLQNCRNYQYKIKDVLILKKLIKIIVSEKNNADLNWIDVSAISDMSYLFFDSPFNGDISLWNVSNVTNMSNMFFNSKFNGNISNWNVSNVINMRFMFHRSKFNKDISAWQINPLADIYSMFLDSDIDDSNKPIYITNKQ